MFAPIIGDVKTRSLEHNSRRLDHAMDFTCTGRADGQWLISETLFGFKALATSFTFIGIDRHGDSLISIERGITQTV